MYVNDSGNEFAESEDVLRQIFMLYSHKSCLNECKQYIVLGKTNVFLIRPGHISVILAQRHFTHSSKSIRTKSLITRSPTTGYVLVSCQGPPQGSEMCNNASCLITDLELQRLMFTCR
jgi:hypothetical protein